MKYSKLVMGAAFSALAVWVSSPAAQAVETLKFAHVYETGHPLNKEAEWAAEEFKKRTNGRYEINVYPSSSLGKETDLNEALSLGTVDIIYTGPSFVERYYGPIAISDYPFIMRGYDHWKNFDNVFSNYTNPNLEDRTDSQWSPKVGMRYQFTDQMSGWVNYGTGFTPPTSAQLYDDRTSGGNPREPNPDLEPEKTQSWEIGLEKWMGRAMQASVTGYYNITDDKILSWFNDSNVWVNKNIGETQSYGTELALALYLSDNWTVSANYTYTHATIKENPSALEKEDNYLPFTPRNKANIGITYERAENFSINLMGRYLGEQFVSDTNARVNASGESLVMDESFVCDVKVIKHLKPSFGGMKGVDLSMSVDNVFGEDYRSYYMYEDPGTVLTAQVDFIF